MGSHIFVILVTKKFFAISKCTRMFVLYVKSKVVYTQFNKSLNSKSFKRVMHSEKVTKLDHKNYICPKVT